ncbi:flagellar protein FlgN [Propionispora hippei]|uniref:FlgN protein n=1 Tax=Propionispora hippei DSM 15287 TaxID=1123003 RepID=A0A1M6FFN6_9FIRM|nr:flagellar protein FlgN [Propionispora hippei]SHI96483.1 FlgN protein [Propionispora hippei DSM 15287]
MEELCNKLTVLLTDMLQVYTNILALGKRKKDALVAGKVNELETITKEEEQLILQAGKLEKTRTGITQDILAKSGLQTDKLTLTEIKDLAGSDIAEQLSRLGDELGAALQEIKATNELNTKLIQRAMAYVDYNINILTQHSTGPVYAAQGQAGKSVQSRMLVDQKA